MSYCRFQNTSMDLADCLDALENHWDLDLSTDEVNGLENLLADAKELVWMEDTINEVWVVTQSLELIWLATNGRIKQR